MQPAENIRQHIEDSTAQAGYISIWPDDNSECFLVQDMGGDGSTYPGRVNSIVAVTCRSVDYNTARDNAFEIYDLYKNYGAFNQTLPAPDYTGGAEMFVNQIQPARPADMPIEGDHYAFTFNLQLVFFEA